jgi:DNA-binding transcriptional LysR family regulator
LLLWSSPGVTVRIDLNDIRLLMQVVESGSFTAASRALGVPKSTISQRIAALERAVGTGLLRRTSRSFSLTEAGSLLLPHARAIDDLSHKIHQALLEQGPDIAGTLRVSSSVVLAQFALATLVPKFLAEHRRVVIQVDVSNSTVDLIGGGFDMAVRGHLGPLKDSTLLQRVVARTPWSLAASPGWIAAHGAPTSPGELPADEVLCCPAADAAPWRLGAGADAVTVAMRPRLLSDDMVTLRDAAIAGAGITCLPTYVMASALRAGLLVPLLAEWPPRPSSISVLTPPKLQSSRLAQAFSDFLAREMPRAVRGMERSGA